MSSPRSAEPLAVRPVPLNPLLFLVFIFYLNLTSRVTLGPVLPIIEGELGIGHGEAGALFALVQIGYCAGLLVSGFASSRWTHRRLILVSTTALGLVLLAISAPASLNVLRVELFLLGTSAGLYLPSGIATVTRVTHQKHWGKAMAVHELAPNLGYITAPLLVEFLLRLLPWRGILGVLGLLAILAGVCFGYGGKGGSHCSDPPNTSTVRSLIRNPTLWVTAMLFAMAVGSGLSLYTMLPLFLVNAVGLERRLANTITGLSRLPGLGAIFFAGMLTDRIGHRRALAVILFATGVLTIAMGLLRGGMWIGLSIFLQAAAGASFYPAVFSMISLIFPLGVRSLAVSFIMILGSLLGGGAIPPMIGYLAEMFSFPVALCCVGLLTLSLLPLLREEKQRTKDKNQK